MEIVYCNDYEGLRAALTTRLFGVTEPIGGIRQIMVRYFGREPNGTLRMRFADGYVEISNAGEDRSNAYELTDPESVFYAMHKVLVGHDMYFKDVNLPV